jgi:hypothetical protein
MSNEVRDDAPFNLSSAVSDIPSEQDSDNRLSPQTIPVPAVVRPKRRPGKVRTDKEQTHYSCHGLLSRDIERALVRLGESLRNLRRWERKFRSVLKPQGDVAELIFDKWWSCHLRQLLIAKVEAAAFLAGNPKRVSLRLPVLQEQSQPTLVYAPDGEEDENFGQHVPHDLLQQLSVTQRYDAHYSREGNRLFGLLLLMRDGGESTLVEILETNLGVNK